jgi:hypothetical protein
MLGMPFGSLPCHSTAQVVRPDSLYKERVFTAGIGTCGTKKNLKLRYETLTPPFIQHTYLYDCILSLCYLKKFLVESSSFVYLFHKYELATLLPRRVFAYADDLKIVAGVLDQDQVMIQSTINVIQHWSVNNMMPLSLEKCFVLHCGVNNSHLQYTLDSMPLPTTAHLKVIRI